MPNNITNQITFGSDSAALAAFQRMLHDVRMEDQPLGSFDFNKLLPMPQELDMEAGTRTDRGLKLVREYHHALTDLEQQKPALTPEEYAANLRQCEGLYRKKRMADPETWALGAQAYRNIQRFGSPTWYEWCNRNWGTKWNAYQPRPLGENDHTMEFYTAWGSVPKIISLLSRKYPEQTITYRWADEDIGHNVGEFTIKDGEVIDINVPESGSREAYEMAAEIMDVSLSDYDLYLTKDESGYEYREPVSEKYQELEAKILGITKIMVDFSLTDGQKSELRKVAGEIDAAHRDGSLSGDERQRLLRTMTDCGFEPPLAPAEQAKQAKKKRGAAGRDR